MTQKLLKLALEFVESVHDGEWGSSTNRNELVAAIKEALAQEQAPVAWVSEDVCEGQYINGRPRKIWWECEKGVGTAFYTHPPQRTKQELIAYLYNMGYKAGHNDTLEGTYIDIFRQDMSTYHSDVVSEWLEDEGYTTPPQRTWVGLTDEEIDLVCVGLWSGGWRKKAMQDFAKVIEAKLKQVNGYAEENT